MAEDKMSKGASATPTIYYLDLGSLGRGEIVRYDMLMIPDRDLYLQQYRLFLKDAAIQFVDVRYPYDDKWKQTSKSLESQGLTLTGKLPTLDYNGHLLTQVSVSFASMPLMAAVECLILTHLLKHLSILRYLARELGAYDGKTSYEKYLVDCVADVYNDWRVSRQRVRYCS